MVENAGFGAAHAAPIARRVFDYVLMGQYPNEEDMAAVQKGLAAAPIGKPRLAADMAGLLASGNGTASQPIVAANAANAASAVSAKAVKPALKTTAVAAPVRVN